MRRRLINLVTLVSIVMFVGVAVLWVRTVLREDIVRFPGRRHSLYTTPHAAWWVFASRPYWEGPWHNSDKPDAAFYRSFGPFFGFTRKPAPSGTSYACLGFIYMSYDQPPPQACRFTYVAVPLWLPLMLSAAMPALWLRRRAKRRGPDLCPRCGYDLRASPDRCPECGTAVSVSTGG